MNKKRSVSNEFKSKSEICVFANNIIILYHTTQIILLEFVYMSKKFVLSQGFDDIRIRFFRSCTTEAYTKGSFTTEGKKVNFIDFYEKLTSNNYNDDAKFVQKLLLILILNK